MVARQLIFKEWQSTHSNRSSDVLANRFDDVLASASSTR